MIDYDGLVWRKTQKVDNVLNVFHHFLFQICVSISRIESFISFDKWRRSQTDYDIRKLILMY